MLSFLVQGVRSASESDCSTGYIFDDNDCRSTKGSIGLVLFKVGAGLEHVGAR